MKTNCDYLESVIESISRIAVNAADKAKSGLPLADKLVMIRLERTMIELRRQLIITRFEVEDIDNH